MKKSGLLTALIVLVAVSGGISAANLTDVEVTGRDQLSVQAAWVAEAMPGQSMTAAYMTISNEGDIDENLVSVESEVAENLELHEMVQQGDMMRMRRVDSIVIGPGEDVALEPGGLHIMLIGLTREVTEGDTVELNLIFESGANLTVSAPVKKR
jgi:copper(I)-binding protein